MTKEQQTPQPVGDKEAALFKRKGRVATMAQRREARQRLREEMDRLLEANPQMNLREAGEQALQTVQAEYAAMGLDWATLLPFLMEFIMALLEAFSKRQA